MINMKCAYNRSSQFSQSTIVRKGLLTRLLLALTLSLPESNLEPTDINVAVPFESMDESLECDHSNEKY